MAKTVTDSWLPRPTAPRSRLPARPGIGNRRRRRRRWLGLDEAGAGTLEFALAAPILITILSGILEFGMILFVTMLMEGSLREASRFGITGTSPPGVSRAEQIVQIMNENLMGLVDLDTADVTQTVYPSFGDVNEPEPFSDSAPANGVYDPGEPFTDVNGNGAWDADMGAAGLGGPGDVVIYSVEYDWPLLTPILSPIMGQNGLFRLRASTAVRNEPFLTAGGG